MRFEPTKHSLIVAFDSNIDEELVRSIYIGEPIKLIQRLDGKVSDCYQLIYKDIASVDILLNYLKILHIETYWEIGRDKRTTKRYVENNAEAKQFGFMKRAKENIYIKSPTDCIFCELTSTYWKAGDNT